MYRRLEVVMFNKIDMEKWERAEHYKYYTAFLKTNYTMNVEIDITKLYKFVKSKGLKFFPAMLYAVIKGVNMNKEFRMAYKDGELGYYDHCDPSYTIFHPDDKTFSDLWSEYHEDFMTFYNGVVEDLEKYRDVKGVKVKDGRGENFCPISSVPWVNFTSVSHDTYTEPGMLFPVIVFGKFVEKDGKVLIPLSVFATHAVADGWHTSKLVNDIQENVNSVDSWIGENL